jgi:nucleoside-diphosphate-sugar epimerase
MQALITGISGEVGHGLIKKLHSQGYKVVAADIKEPEGEISEYIDQFYSCDISDKEGVDKIFEEKHFDIIFHLASILSTGGEKNPELAAKVNIEGTLNLLEAATNQSLADKKAIKFIFPSSIAAYGIPNLKVKGERKKVKEDEYLNPITIYGISKLACENLGNYFSKNYKLLGEINRDNLIDFRCVRFPGLLSPDTVPSGGTSDYGPEMIHAAAQGKNYECFVREDSRIPFMAMADAADVLTSLAEAPKENLKSFVYNVQGFSVSALQIYDMTKKFFPNFEITYKINEERQAIVDSWPEDVDDTNAQKDWGWKPKYNYKKTFSEYLIPKIKQRYLTPDK